MYIIRRLRAGTVIAVIAWKLTVLAMLPAAICCQAMAIPDGEADHACCADGHHGAACPLKTGGSETRDLRQLQSCDSLDDALVGLLGLIGDVPETCDLTGELTVRDRLGDGAGSVLSLGVSPNAPPPRI
jgi:hypothetical protein